MRVRISVVAVSTAVLFTVGCSQGARSMVPTSPSLVTSGTGALSAGGPVVQASSSTDVVQIPVGFTIQPSAQAFIEACVGEAVTFQGSALVLAHQTQLPDGSTVLDLLHFNGQGAVAVGASSGINYHVTGADTNPIVVSRGAVTATFVANLRVIGPGPAKSFLAHVLQHITIIPDGTFTALIDVVSIECR